MRLYGVLIVGVVAVSFAAVLICLAEAPALAIAAYRLGLASLVVAPVALAREGGGFTSLKPSHLLWCLASSLFLAIHFAAWIASREHISVASSVVLVTTSPLLVAAVSHLVDHERVIPPVVGGIALGLVGGLVLGLGDRAAGGRELYGNLLALVGAAAAGGYLLVGRRVRRQVSNLTYIGLVYPGAALALLAAAVITRTPLSGFAPDTYIVLRLIALAPQLLGHSSLNWALGQVSATLLVWIILAEAPPWTSVAGGCWCWWGCTWLFGVLCSWLHLDHHGALALAFLEGGR